MTLVLKNALILTGQPPATFRADISINGDRIEQVAPALSASGAEVHDCSHFLVTPGFVNGHIHLNQVLNRGFLDDLPTEQLLANMHLRHGLKSDEDRYWGSLLSISEGLRSGTTYFSAFATSKGRIADAMDRAGVRGTLTVAKKDQWWGEGRPPVQQSLDQIVASLARDIDTWSLSRVSLSIGAASDRAASEALLRQVRDLATDRGCRIFIHVSEGAEAVSLSKKHRGKTPIAFLASEDFLRPDVTLIHASCASDADLALVAHHGASICHCPISNAKSGAGTFPFLSASALSVPMCLGTDAASAGNTNNVLLEAYVATLIHKAMTGDPSVLSPEVVFHLLTLGGANAVGARDRIGHIAPGFKADMVLWDLNQSAFLPNLENPLHSLIYCASELRASRVLIDGEVVLDGLPTRFALDDVHAQMRMYGARQSRDAVLQRTIDA